MPFLFAMDFIEVLKKKHASGTYKEMVMRTLPLIRIYVIKHLNDCQKGSIVVNSGYLC